MDFAAQFERGQSYRDFLEQYGTDEHRQRWQTFYDSIALDTDQRGVLESFVREMKVLVLAGTWCGDCVNQCPILERITQANPKIHVRYLDRDDNPELTEVLSINGGHRVPVAVFLSEDGYVCGRYGDRTLAKYRQMASSLAPGGDGESSPDENFTERVIQEWVDEFERYQLMLRTSGRLREQHGD